MAQSSQNAQIKIDKGQTGSFIELAKVTNSSHEKMLELLETTEYGQDAQQRTDGRIDFTLDCDVNLDLSETSHTDLYDALRDGALVDVEVYPNRANTAKVSATCRVSSGSNDLPGDGEVTESFSFENADGTKWTYTT